MKTTRIAFVIAMTCLGSPMVFSQESTAVLGSVTVNATRDGALPASVAQRRGVRMDRSLLGFSCCMDTCGTVDHRTDSVATKSQS